MHLESDGLKLKEGNFQWKCLFSGYTPQVKARSSALWNSVAAGQAIHSEDGTHWGESDLAALTHT